jgi:hypothetical protein
MKRLRCIAIVCGSALFGLAPVRAPALTLVNNPEDLGDGVLSGSGEEIRTNVTDAVTFWWNDKNGDGAPAWACWKIATGPYVEGCPIRTLTGVNT